MTPLPKKSSDRFRRLLTPLLTLVTASVCSAQTAAPAKEVSKEEEVIVLTPFTVDATKDKGYYAENTLAGSRLRTNVSDLAASISVITKQQLDDTASVDINDVFRYEINTEGSTTYTVAQQSLRSDGFADTGSGFNLAGGTAVQTNATSNRVRGLGVPSSAINYYPSIGQLPVDSYNVQSLEISRGPNSMLFGMGSPAGIVNQSWAQAVLNRDKYTVALRFDDRGSYRGTFSFNQSIIKDKLAIYGALLYNNQQFVRKPSEDITKRKYGALTFKPFRKTVIRASAETYKNNNRRPNTLTPRDSVTQWRLAGEPGYDPVTKRVTTKDGKVRGPYIMDPLSVLNTTANADQTRAYIESLPGFNPALWNTTGTAKTVYNGIGIFNADNAQLTTFSNAALPISPTTTNALFVPGISTVVQSRSIMRIADGQLVDWFMPLGNQQYRTAWGTPAAPESNAALFPTKANIWASPVYSDIHNRFFTASGFWTNNGTQVGSYKYPGVTDKSVYDWENININQMNYGYEQNTTYNLELEQELLSNLFLNAGYFQQDFKSISNYTVAQLNVATLFVDTNKNLLDGRANPYFGQVYMEDIDPDQAVNLEKSNHYRAMLAYTPDFTKKNGWIKWLGHHQLLGLWSKQDTMRTFLRQRLHYTAAGSDAAKFRFMNNQNNTLAGAPTGWSYQSTSLRHMYYLGAPGDPAGTVSRSSGEWNFKQYTGNINVYDYASSSFQNQNMTTEYINRTEGTGRNEREIESVSAGLTSYLWNDRLITTFGVRKDDYRARGTTNATINRQELSTGDATNDIDINTLKVVRAGLPVGIIKNRTAQENFPNGFYETEQLFNRWNRWDELSGTTRTAGAVLKPFKGWGSIDRRADSGSLWWKFVRDFGISYNQSDNFNAPDTAQVDAFGVPLPKPTGEGKDYGFQFALSDKLFARVTWFESSNVNERANPGTSISRLTGNHDTTLYRNWARYIAKINMGMDPRLATFNDTLPAAVEQQVQDATAVIWNQPYTYYDNVGSIFATRTADAKGVELQVNYNPARNWTMKFTGGKQTTVYSKVNKQYEEWYNFRSPVWDAATGAKYLLPQYQSLVTHTTSGGRAVDLTTFWTSYGYDTNVRLDEPNGNFNTQLYYNGTVLAQYLLNKDLDGQAAPNQRRYRGAVITNYTFEGDRFKGFFVGGSQRWESKQVIGYYGKPTGKNILNPNLLEVSDTTRPIYDTANFYTDLWIGYTRKIFNGKVGMRVQLNINDVFENGGLQAVAVNYDASPYAFRIVDSRQFVLTSTFEF